MATLKRRPDRFTMPKPSRKGMALVIGTALLGWGAASNAAVNVFHFDAPAIALSLDSEDPVALVRDAQTRFNAGEVQGGSAEMLALVQRSVARLPINGPAFRLYGLTSATNADLPEVRAQMAISDRMERRDAAAQLWLIEDAVSQNDVTRALRHYDTALRVQQSSRAILYPALTDALESPVIRERFLPYLSARPPWLESFLRYAVSNTKAPVAIAQLAQSSGGFPAGQAYSSLDRELLTQLVAFEDFETAIAHFSRIKNADQAVLTSLALTASSTDNAYAPVTWQPFEIDGIEPFIVAAEGGEQKVEIEAEVEAGYKGPVARKLLALKPGSYALSARMRADNFGGADGGRWTIRCAGRSGSLALLQEDFGLADEFTVGGRMTVPADCPVQTIMVSADTKVATGYVTIVLADVELGPALDVPVKPASD